jgi:hypothetical protein
MASIKAATDRAASQTAVRTGLVLDMILNLRRGLASQTWPCSVATARHAKEMGFGKKRSLWHLILPKNDNL